MHIKLDLSSKESGPYLGLLTALDREEWALLYTELWNQSASRAVLQQVNSALFVVVLDDVDPGTDVNEAAKQMLIGKGCDRWFDKWQMIVTKEGQAGFNLEHSPYDGHTFVSMFNYMENNRQAANFAENPSSESSGVYYLDPGPLSSNILKGI
jgi:carnitine O-acetyltransferase